MHQFLVFDERLSRLRIELEVGKLVADHSFGCEYNANGRRKSRILAYQIEPEENVKYFV
jgi:hypothetical protein